MKRVGPYDVVRELGRGAMGVVYEVRSQGGERLALKMILQPEVGAKERFRREAEVLSFLGRHPGIVTFRDAGLEGGHPYIVMDFVEGRTLADALKAGLPRERALEVLVRVARALHFAHEAEVVHRDIKPANILLCANDRPLLSDFGVAKSLRADRLTETGEVVGTPEYMAPEQLGGGEKTIERRTDVYALGAVLHEVLSGARPFRGGRIEVVKAILLDPPPALPIDLPADLRALCEACLAKDASDRPASCEEVARALEAHLRGAPPALPRAPARRWPAVLIGVAALAAGIGAGWVLKAKRGEKQAAINAAFQREQRQAETIARAEARERQVSLARGEPSAIAAELRGAKPLATAGDAWEASSRLLAAARRDPGAVAKEPGAAARLIEAAGVLLRAVDPSRDADAPLVEQAWACLVTAQVLAPGSTQPRSALQWLPAASASRVAAAASPWRDLWRRTDPHTDARWVERALEARVEASAAVDPTKVRTFPKPWGAVVYDVASCTDWWQGSSSDAARRVAVFGELLVLRPELLFLRYRLGLALCEVGRRAEGVRLMRAGLTQHRGVHFRLGRVLAEWCADYAAAEVPLRQSVRMAKGVVEDEKWGLRFLAEALYQQGSKKQLEQAHQILNSKALAGGLTTYSTRWRDMARVAEKQGKSAAAEALWLEERRLRRDSRPEGYPPPE